MISGAKQILHFPKPWFASPTRTELLSRTGECSKKPSLCKSSDLNTISIVCPFHTFGDAKRFLREVVMAAKHLANVSQSSEGFQAKPSQTSRIILPGVDVVREGRAEPFLNAPPTLSSATAQWGGIALENYATPAVFIPRHEHPEHFLHLVLRGNVKYEVNTKGRNLGLLRAPAQSFSCLGARWMK
jgi:hypothetical protein